jgi:medium-chain acyl-[acyl-carrier-protein] hydrolase
MTDKVYSQKFTVRNFDVDFKGKLKLEMLLNFLQESAAEHAFQLGLSGEELLKKNLAWILSRYHIEINYYPQKGETIEVKTWPCLVKEIFTLREYEIHTLKSIAAKATSSWMAVDLKKKKPVKIKERLPSFPMYEKRAINDEFKRLPDFNKSDMELRFPVLKADLDFNRHVNNVVYIKCAVETVPEKVIMNSRLTRIEANYRNETFYGDWIISRTQNIREGENPQYIHQLLRESDGQEIARLKTEWTDL